MSYSFKREVRESLLSVEGIILIAAIVALTIFFGSLSKPFLTLRNFIIILETMSILAIVSMGMKMLLVAGEIDISTIRIMEFAATIAALASIVVREAVLIIVIAITLSALVGVVNGYLSAYVRIPSFLVTLATNAVLLGTVLVLTKYSSIPMLNRDVMLIFYGYKVGGMISISTIWMVVIITIIGIFLKYFRLGRWIYMTGGNTRNAWLLGIPVQRVKFITFIINSVLASIAGLIAVSISVSARAYMADAYLMPSIAAPILGGASLTGGTGSVVRTVLAAFLLTMITNGTYLLGVEPALYNVIMGVVLVSALSIRFAIESGVFSRVIESLKTSRIRLK